MVDKAEFAESKGASGVLLLNGLLHSGPRIPQIHDGAQPPSCETNCQNVSIPTLLLTNAKSKELLPLLNRGLASLTFKASTARMDLWADLIDLKHSQKIHSMDEKQTKVQFWHLLHMHHPESLLVRSRIPLQSRSRQLIFFAGIN